MNIYDDPSREKMGYSGRHIYREEGDYYYINVSKGRHSSCGSPGGMIVCLALVIWPTCISYYITKEETCKEIIKQIDTHNGVDALVLPNDYFLNLCAAAIPVAQLMKACFVAGKNVGQDEVQHNIKQALGLE